MTHHSTVAAARWTDAPARRRPVVVAIVLAMCAALSLSVLVVRPAMAAVQTVNLVTINDFHGRIERESTTTGAGGAAALATAVNQIRAANSSTVFAAAGDLIGASTFTSFIQQDVPTIDALNAAGLDVSAAGNHEFDQGWADLRDRVQGLADWEYISSNVFLKGTDDTALAESWTKTLPNGVTMGFVGAVTEELPSLVSPAGITDLEVRDIVDSVNAAADRLVDGDPANGEADVVVLLVHEGAATPLLADATDPNSPFGQIVLGVDDDVDAIVSGHTHLAYNHVINGRPVISSGQYGEKFSNMTIQYDTATDQLISMTNVTQNVAPFADDPTVAAIVAAAKAAADISGNVQVGQVTGDLNRALQPGIDPITGLPVIVENRGGESTLGNFVADVQLWAVGRDAPVDIAFMNPGGLRQDIKFAPDNGVVTYREAANVQPFANTLVALTLTGAQVKAVLEQQWQPAGASRPFLKMGVNKELSYVYDPTAAAGSRILRITLNGEELDPTAGYRVVANSFLASGGDNFFAFTGGTNKVDTGKVDLQAMVDWFAEFGTAVPDLEQRAVGFDVTTPNAEGEKLDVKLSSLDFSTTELDAGSVELSLGGVSFGSQPVDSTLLQRFDEIGKASYLVDVPESLYGWQDLTAFVPATGTTATLPIFLKATTDSEVTVNAPSPSARAQVSAWVSIESPLEIEGSFTVLVDGASIGSFAYVPNDEGLVKVKLPRTLGAGSHTIRVVFPGSADLLSSTDTFTLTLR